MACPDVNDPCNPCSEDCLDTNPCYDNCGCLNPTTWECITKPGNHPEFNVTNDMNGSQVLTQIGVAFADIQDQIDNLEIGALPEGVDINVKVSAADTTTGYLAAKISTDLTITKAILNPGANELVSLKVKPSALISTDAGNALGTGTDGKLKVTVSGSTFYFAEGTGISIDGAGTQADPAVFSLANNSIQAARACFTGIWNTLTLGATGNANVTYVSGSVKYRFRHDGSIEFKGSPIYTVNFGAYGTAERKFTITIGAIPTTCLSALEQTGIADLKSINYIDIPQASADQLTQTYGYIIRKSGTSIILEFQSSFSNTTSKTIGVSFDGAVSHPNI